MTRRLLAVVAALAVFASAFALAPGGAGDFTVEAEFERTFNLFPNSPVRVRGVEVGIVQGLRTEPGTDGVIVTMLLDGDTQMPADTNAVIITASLLGERYVQLEGGEATERLADGDRIPIDRTFVPFEFDEVLEGLNDFVGGLDETEVARLVTNLSDLLEGNGAQLGSTIDAASGAVAALKENDEELLALASAVADLNETLATRDTQLAALLDDWIRVTDTLTSESTDLDGALDNLVVLTREIAELMLDHRETLSEDVDTLTRVARTSNRNLDNISTAVLGSAELFRHAERVIDRETNMLPLVNHSAELQAAIRDSLLNRLEGLCLAGGGTPEECDLDAIADAIEEGENGELCVPGLIPCEAEGASSTADIIEQAIEINDTIGQQLLEQHQQDGGSGDSAVAEALERAGLLPRGGAR